MRHLESNIQIAAFNWFAMQYPEIKPLLFAVPNGGYRNAATARIMRAEGVVAGVSDCILLIANAEYNALCIEFKTEKGKQTDKQRAWQAVAERHGNKYVIVRSVEEFIKEISNYLKASDLWVKF